MYEDHTYNNRGPGRGRGNRNQRNGEFFGGRGDYDYSDTSTIGLQ